MSTETLGDSFPNEFFDEIPPALVVDVADPDVGQCNDCGIPVRRPEGESPTGRKLRIPKYCDDCKSTRKNTPGKTGSRRKSVNADIEQGVTDLYTAIGAVILKYDQPLGMAIIGEERLARLLGEASGPAASIAEDAGAEWAKLAAHYPAVNSVLAPLVQTSMWTGIVRVHAPAVMHLVQRPRTGKVTGRVKGAMARMRLRRRVRASEGETDDE